MGQSCVASKRFIPVESVSKTFIEKFKAKMGSLKIGRGTEPDVKVGPLIDEPSREKVAELVQDAIDKGATRVVGGEIPFVHLKYRPLATRFALANTRVTLVRPEAVLSEGERERILMFARVIGLPIIDEWRGRRRDRRRSGRRGGSGKKTAPFP